ncbi:unnamed protein product [Pieris macdunnoughi]|uniref:Laminin G domain-containing protein n=1 Tax=Pieris macdunnoughi TaxID=345717 RepID=A0A821WDY0_9NEOP|nr:unnamed protein product [Pieris macdunnoughi]
MVLIDRLETSLGCVVITFAQSEAATPLGPSDRLSRPISLKQLVGLSYRTCVGGELFSQRSEGYTLHVTALYEQVVVSWSRPGQPQREVGIAKETLDNRWHWVALKYRHNPPALLLEVDRESQVISNVRWNGELLSAGALEANGAVVLVGNVFSGCLHEGPQLKFHAAYLLQTNVRFGHCPLTTDECKDRKDVLRIPPKDHCYNEPCLRHGACISRHDRLNLYMNVIAQLDTAATIVKWTRVIPVRPRLVTMEERVCKTLGGTTRVSVLNIITVCTVNWKTR